MPEEDFGADVLVGLGAVGQRFVETTLSTLINELAISGRSDPPLPLGRMRARAEMNEIRAEQLTFSEEEAECLLNEKMGLGTGPDDISVLLERTEG